MISSKVYQKTAMHITTRKNSALAVTATEAVAALLQQGDTVRFTAEGNSMFPLIPSGSTLIVRPFNTTDAKLGAILLFPHGKRLVLHRLVRINKKTGTAQFRGDMHPQGYESVVLTQILGTAIMVRLPDGKEGALHTRFVRWAGMLRYHARPLRRGISRLLKRLCPMRRLQNPSGSAGTPRPTSRVRREEGRANRPGEPL